MPDRTLRDELLDSDRWLWLPNDTDRLAFIGLLLRCDDFGNLEGGPRRLFRFFNNFTHVKTEEGSATVLLHLVDADLIRRYEVDGREFFHIPRLRVWNTYLVRKCPPSPWCDLSVEIRKRVRKQGHAKNTIVAPQVRHSGATAGVVVVDVEVVKPLNPQNTCQPETPKPDPAPQTLKPGFENLLKHLKPETRGQPLTRDEQLRYVDAMTRGRA